MLKFPIQDTKKNYLDAFWRWVALMEQDDYAGAIEALYWDKPTKWTASKLKERVTTYFGGNDSWHVVIPNDRLIGVINDEAEFSFESVHEDRRWFMAQIPLTTKPDDPKNDKIPLMGLASSFYVRKLDGQLVLEHEIFHI